MKTRYSVYCPAVPLAMSADVEGESCLFEIYAEHYRLGEDLTDRQPTTQRTISLDDKAIRKQWEPVAAPLRSAGLYESGCTAVAAVRKLGLTPPPGAVYQKFHRLAYVNDLRLHLTAARAPSEWQTHAGAIEGRSAELALALALLLAASRRPDRLVIATGRLGAQPAGTRSEDPDVEVLEVGKVPEKLRLIERLALDHKLPRGPNHTDSVWVFTPATFKNGEASVAVETLPEVRRLKMLGITVIQVGTLSEAAGHLAVKRAHWMRQDSVWLGWIVGAPLFLVALAWAASYWWPRDRLVTSPQLTVFVSYPEKRDSSVNLKQAKPNPKKLEEVPRVFLNDKLSFELSPHPGEYRYLFTLDGDGSAYIVGPEKDKPFIIPKEGPPVFVTIMLVTSKLWSADQLNSLNKKISGLQLKPTLPREIRYHFLLQNCIPMRAPSAPPTPIDQDKGGPPVYGEDESTINLPDQCDAWANQLLNTLLHEMPNKTRIDGYAFQIAKY